MNKNSLACSCTHKWSLLGSVSKLFMAFEMSGVILPFLQLFIIFLYISPQ